MAHTNYTNIWNYLEKFSKERFLGTHNIHTHRCIVKNAVANVIHYKNKNPFLTTNLQYVIELLSCGVKSKDITLLSDNTRKNSMCEKLGVKYIMNIDDFKSKKRPVLQTNPPYTDGTSAANDIYTGLIERIINEVNPIAICGVTPENLINGGQKKKTLREKISKQYGWKTVKFLNQVRDWKGDIAIDTISWVVEEGYAGPTTVTGRVLNEDYTVDMTKFSELVNGETQGLHDWMTRIQTAKKLVLNNPAGKDTGKTGLQIKISKDAVDSCAVEPGKEFNSHNTEWRVAFGYLRCNTCAVVPPGPSISGKYRYLNFGVNGEVQARRFAQYMLSEPVRLIILLTYNSRSLDNPQLSYVPMIDLNQFTNMSNDVLYQYWNTSTVTQQTIASLVGGKVPF